MEEPTQNNFEDKIENTFERGLWALRFSILSAVIFGLIGAFILFAVASIDIYNTLILTIDYYFGGAQPENFHTDVVGLIIGAVDLYLIGVVMLLFSFGLYELFISKIDTARANDENKVLEIGSLDQLKDKISKVIVMVLVVGFFQKVGTIEYSTPMDMLFFAGSICMIAVGLFFLSKVGKKH